MKTYDFQKAREIIEQNRDSIHDAALGMHEDWFWTAETIFSEGEFTHDLDDDSLIGGIKGSIWATPVLEITFKDGRNQTFNCYKGESDKSHPAGFELGLGCLSGPTQQARVGRKIEEV